ncbi:MAG: lysoplasmalogenase family protein [Clostridiales Family XIII bacterium]|nr:lysoplasmalogenase family protein [Clostridiales Family XIII bacterium]
MRFTLADMGFDGRLASVISSDRLKYVSICICLAISLIVLRSTPYRRDALLQVLTFAFTLVADFIILFTPRFSVGIMVFCGAHITALIRYTGIRDAKRVAVATGIILAGSCITLIASRPVMFDDVAIFHFDSELRAELIAAIAYAILITSTTISAFRRRQARMNNIMSRLGMILFMLCDVNVLMWNLRGGVGLTAIPEWTGTRIWTFYLPGQTMLAMSAMDFGRPTNPSSKDTSPVRE